MSKLHFVILFIAISMCNAVYAMNTDKAFEIGRDPDTDKKTVVWKNDYKTNNDYKFSYLALQNEAQKSKIQKLENQVHQLSPKSSIWTHATKAHKVATIAGIFGGFFGFTCICPAALPVAISLKMGLGAATVTLGSGAVIGNGEKITQQIELYQKHNGKQGMSGLEITQDIVKPIAKAAVITGVACFGVLGIYHLRKVNATFMP